MLSYFLCSVMIQTILNLCFHSISLSVPLALFLLSPPSPPSTSLPFFPSLLLTFSLSLVLLSLYFYFYFYVYHQFLLLLQMYFKTSFSSLLIVSFHLALYSFPLPIPHLKSIASSFPQLACNSAAQ